VTNIHTSNCLHTGHSIGVAMKASVKAAPMRIKYSIEWLKRPVKHCRRKLQ